MKNLTMFLVVPFKSVLLLLLLKKMFSWEIRYGKDLRLPIKYILRIRICLENNLNLRWKKLWLILRLVLNKMVQKVLISKMVKI